MEYTQWVVILHTIASAYVGLNPCCNGIYSMSCSFLFIKSRTCLS